VKLENMNHKQLVKKLDTVFSLFIRNRDDYKCCVCGATKETAVIQCGHLITRSNFATRWDEKNCYAQCSGCNMAHEYHPEMMTHFFVNKFGVEEYNKLVIRSQKPPKFSHEDLIYMIKFYQGKIK
jgi:hypothetical protein